jgi:death-on-curing protein
MAIENWDWVSVDDAILSHQQSIANYGGSEGVRDAGSLESALAYPQNIAAHGDPGLAELAAGYLFAVAKNHAFVDGNKRTAWTVMRLFVALNGGRLDYERLEAVRFVEGVASGAIDYDGARVGRSAADRGRSAGLI